MRTKTAAEKRAIRDRQAKNGLAAKFRDRNTRGNKISLGEIHRRSGFSMAHISKIFSGKRLPSLGAAARIATAKGISIDELYVELSEIRQGIGESGEGA